MQCSAKGNNYVHLSFGEAVHFSTLCDFVLYLFYLSTILNAEHSEYFLFVVLVLLLNNLNTHQN